MIKGLVSVITPTYNHEKFLASCLDSVITQTYSNWEIIIVDDGSTDKTGNIGRKYAEEYPNIHYIHQENIGPYRLYETYNKALDITKGEFVAILEGDDFWYPDKLQLQVKEIKKQPEAVLCWGKAKSVYAESLEVIREHPGKNKDPRFFSNNPVGSILNLLYIDNCIPALTILIRTRSLSAIGGFRKLENLPLVDYPTLLELSLKGTFVYVNEFLGAWRLYPQQVTKTHTLNIKKGLHEYASYHYRKNLGNSSVIHNIDWNNIQNKFRDQIIISYARAGRYKLINRDFKGARKDYFSALKIGLFKQPVWKIRALTGIVFSLFKTDVEGLAKALKKIAYK